MKDSFRKIVDFSNDQEMYFFFKGLQCTQKSVILIAFDGKNGLVNAPQCYYIRTLPVLSV
jgi:hypothetical protein